MFYSNPLLRVLSSTCYHAEALWSWRWNQRSLWFFGGLDGSTFTPSEDFKFIADHRDQSRKVCDANPRSIELNIEVSVFCATLCELFGFIYKITSALITNQRFSVSFYLFRMQHIGGGLSHSPGWNVSISQMPIT